MSDPRRFSDESAEEAWNVRVQELGQRFGFPPTPDIAGAVRQRLSRRQGRLSPLWVRAGIALVIVVLVIVLAVPDLRAKAFDFPGIGAVRILRDEPDTHLLDTGFDPAYETTLDDAQEQVNYPIRQPAYPPDLGSPDAVYLYPNDMVILVWAGDSQLSLTLIDSREMVFKHYADQEIVTTVNGHEAMWLGQTARDRSTQDRRAAYRAPGGTQCPGVESRRHHVPPGNRSDVGRSAPHRRVCAGTLNMPGVGADRDPPLRKEPLRSLRPLRFIFCSSWS
jgi:hypothetical protein